MKIYTWNVNGIRAVEKKGFLEWLEQTRPDILCLQETKCWPAQLSYELLEGHGYHAHWHSAQKKGYSSVATFCREEPLAVHKGLGVEIFDNEGRALVTEHPGFVLYNCYFPNGQHDLGRVPYKLSFYRELLKQANQRVLAGQNVVIGGDWNTAHTPLDLKNARANEGNTGFLPEERAMIDHYLSQGYVDAFRSLHPDGRDQYTWWSFRSGARERNIGWRIDYFMVNAALMPRVKACEIHPEVMGSDHCPVSIEIVNR
ncbi:MAG: exodeoxyribonuclease III [Candidatus Sericytochromatia bacterium]